jgi:hypothetical protein
MLAAKNYTQTGPIGNKNFSPSPTIGIPPTTLPKVNAITCHPAVPRKNEAICYFSEINPNHLIHRPLQRNCHILHLASSRRSRLLTPLPPHCQRTAPVILCPVPLVKQDNRSTIDQAYEVIASIHHVVNGPGKSNARRSRHVSFTVATSVWVKTNNKKRTDPFPAQTLC